MNTAFVLAAVFLGVYAQYETENSGYGNNNEYEVQKAAKKSPYNKPVDYTNHGEPEYKKPDYNADGCYEKTGKKPVIIPVKTIYSDVPSNDKPTYPAKYGGGNIQVNKIVGAKISTITPVQNSGQGQEHSQNGGGQYNTSQSQNNVKVGQSYYQAGPGGYTTPAPPSASPTTSAASFPEPANQEPLNPTDPAPNNDAPQYAKLVRNAHVNTLIKNAVNFPGQQFTAPISQL